MPECPRLGKCQELMTKILTVRGEYLRLGDQVHQAGTPAEALELADKAKVQNREHRVLEQAKNAINFCSDCPLLGLK